MLILCLAFSDLMCHVEDTGIGVVWLHSAVVTFLVVWIFLRSMGVIFYGRWVLSVCHKHYFKDWCLMNSQPTFLFLTYVNLKIVSTIFYQFFIFSPNDDPLKTTKNVFYFIWKALFVLKVFNFLWVFPFQIQKDEWKWNNLWCHELTCINLQM